MLREAIQEGVNRTNWNPDTFTYADRWDEAKGRYVGLEAGRIVSVQLGGGVDLPDDLPDTLVRTITENCRTLGFKTFEFEKESR